MRTRRKFYVVWVGNNPGIYDSWEECKLQITGYPGARYKAFDSQEEATYAYRGDPAEHLGLIRAIASRKSEVVNYSAFPEINLDSIAVDAGCSKNPGPVEYQGVDVRTGERLFHVGPLDDGTNNVGEYLAIIHALAWLDKGGNHTMPVYSDSKTAQSWVRRGHHASKLARNARNARLFELLARADNWLQAHPVHNPVLKWDTERWGEIPADFGRK